LLIEKEKRKMEDQKLYTIKMSNELFNEIYETAQRFQKLGISAEGRTKNDVRMKTSHVVRLAIREGLKTAEKVALAEMKKRHARK